MGVEVVVVAVRRGLYLSQYVCVRFVYSWPRARLGRPKIRSTRMSTKRKQESKLSFNLEHIRLCRS